jgi:hypothetical protein
MKHVAILLLAVSSACSAWAAGGAPSSQNLGKVTNVKGFVTIVAGGNLSNAVSGATFVAGNRVIATSSGGATLEFNNGCVVALKANQSFTVQESSNCPALVASVVGIGADRGSANVVAPADSKGYVVAGGISAVATMLNSAGAASTPPSLTAKGVVGGGWVPNSVK